MGAIQETAKGTRDAARVLSAPAVVLCAAALLLAALLAWPWVPRIARVARARVYCAVREWQMVRTLARVESWEVLRDGRVILHFTGPDEDLAARVAGYASAVLNSISSGGGDGLPRNVHVLLFPSFESMAGIVPSSGEERSVGVYWAGVVGIVSARAWGDMFGEGDPSDLFLRYNPLTHEMAHLWLDYAAAGNYPFWFSEGVAQVLEHRATGYLWPDAAAAGRSGAVTEEGVERAFRSEETLGEAYYGAMLLSDRVLEQLGPGGLTRLAALLRSGRGFHEAVGLASATQDQAPSLLKQGGQR